MKYNSFYKSSIGSLDHEDLHEKVIANILCWGIFDNFKTLLFSPEFYLSNKFSVTAPG